MRNLVLSAVTSAMIVTIAGPAEAAPSSSTPPAVAPSTAKSIGAVKPPNFDAMMTIIEKLFPPQPEPDPARLALARTSVRSMWPDGAYGRMMAGFMGNLFTGVMQMKKSDFASLGNKAGKPTAGSVPYDRSLHDQAAAKDPHFDQRMAAMRDVMNEEFGKMSTFIDPRMRDGLARSMARRFDARTLSDINAFFATPSGSALASSYMQLWFDPDTLRSMFGAFPEMMKLMPDAMQKLKAANDRFPKPPTSAPKPVKH